MTLGPVAIDYLFSFFVIYLFEALFLLTFRGSNNRLDEARRDRNNANRYMYEAI